LIEILKSGLDIADLDNNDPVEALQIKRADAGRDFGMKAAASGMGYSRGRK
jgi:hypothetical protein